MGYPPQGPYYAPQPVIPVQMVPMMPVGPPPKPSPVGKWIGMVGAILGIIGTMLPWISYTVIFFTISISGLFISFYGPLAMICSIIALVFILLPGSKGTLVLAMIFSIIVIIMPIAAMSTFAFQFELYGLEEWVSSAVGFGVYLTIIGGIIAVLGTVMYMAKLDKPGAPAAQPQAPPPQPYAQPPQQYGPPPPQPVYPQQQYGGPPQPPPPY